MSIAPSIPGLLRLVRHERALTRVALAGELGVSPRTLEGWEQGRPYPHPTVLRLALEYCLVGPKAEKAA